MAPNCGTITVAPAFDPSEVVATCSLGSEEAQVGDTISVPFEVINNNSQPADYTVSVLLNGTEVSTESGSVRANSRTSSGVTVELTSPGEITVNTTVTATQG